MICYERLTLIDHLFVRSGQLRFCSLLLVNGTPCRLLGQATSAPNCGWAAAIAEWYKRLETVAATTGRWQQQTQDVVCIIGESPPCIAALELDFCGPRAAEITRQIVVRQLPRAKFIDYGERVAWIEGLYEFADEMNVASEGYAVFVHRTLRVQRLAWARGALLLARGLQLLRRAHLVAELLRLARRASLCAVLRLLPLAANHGLGAGPCRVSRPLCPISAATTMCSSPQC